MSSEAAAGPDEWQRSIRGWHLAFALLATLTGALYLIEGGLSPALRSTALGLLIILCLWYAATGAKVLQRQRSPLGLVYIAGAAPLTVGLYAIRPVGALMLFALYPHIWALLAIRRAIVATALAIGATAVVALANIGLTPLRLFEVFVPAAVGLLVAMAIGVWISRIIEQSQRRAGLVAELAATRAELARVSREAGALAERERLARDIHDTLAQGFASVLLLLEAAATAPSLDAARAHMQRARHTAQENLAEARALVAELTPPALRDASLPDALRRLVDRLTPELGLPPRLSLTGDPRALPADEEVVLLRVAQEALTNVRKHAAATEVHITLSYHDTRVTLTVQDNGRGFTPSPPPTPLHAAAPSAAALPAAAPSATPLPSAAAPSARPLSAAALPAAAAPSATALSAAALAVAGLSAGVVAAGGFGVAGMRDRVAQVGGVLELRSAIGEGTTISVSLAS